MASSWAYCPTLETSITITGGVQQLYTFQDEYLNLEPWKQLSTIYVLITVMDGCLERIPTIRSGLGSGDRRPGLLPFLEFMMFNCPIPLSVLEYYSVDPILKAKVHNALSNGPIATLGSTKLYMANRRMHLGCSGNLAWNYVYHALT